MYYTGIGSRDTPEHIGLIMTDLARELEDNGYILRSGAARGADTFFERGVKDAANKEIYIHQEILRDGRRHNKSKGYYSAQRYKNYIEALQIASSIHPYWHKCDRTAMEMHARNVYQVLGPDLTKEFASSFLVCWAIPDIHGVPEGGTRTAWLLAKQHNISCFNLARQDDRKRIVDWLESRKAA